MSAETFLYTTLQALVSGRVYPDVAPLDAALPYVTYQQVGGAPVFFLENDLPSKTHGRFQINSWAGTRLAATDLARDVEAALFAEGVRPMGDLVAARDETNDAYGAMQDFSVWTDR